MKILIVGAGVIGSVYAVKFAEAGLDVTVLARGSRHAEIIDHGIVIRHFFTGEESVARVNVIERLQPDAAFDFAFVIIRGDQWKDLLPSMEPCMKIQCFLFVGNNPRKPDEILRVLGRDRVMLGFGGIAGHRDGHTVVYVDSDEKNRVKSGFSFGELDGTVTTRARQVEALMKQAGYPVIFLKDPVAWLQSHLLLIMPLVGLLFRAGPAQQKVAADAENIALSVKAFKELVRAFRLLKITVCPGRIVILSLLPDLLVIAFLKKLLPTKATGIALFGHLGSASGASEMRSLAIEFDSLVKKACCKTGAWDTLFRSILESKKNA